MPTQTLMSLRSGQRGQELETPATEGSLASGFAYVLHQDTVERRVAASTDVAEARLLGAGGVAPLSDCPAALRARTDGLGQNDMAREAVSGGFSTTSSSEATGLEPLEALRPSVVVKDVKDLLAAPCQRFLLAQTVCLVVSAVVVLGLAVMAVTQQPGPDDEQLCVVEEYKPMKAPYFLAMFMAGALLNCKEFLGIPTL